MLKKTSHGAAALGLLLGCLTGCGAGAGAGRPPRSGASAGDVAAEGPAGAARHIDTQEEAEAARLDLDYAADERARTPLREALLRYHADQARQALDRGHPDDAFEAFTAALQLYPAAALQDPARPPQAPALLSVAQGLERAFRRRGAYGEVVCALLVQRTLQPKDREVARRYEELASWLAGAPGQPLPWRQARRPGEGLLSSEVPAQLVRSLESTAKAWPAAAVIDELSALYLAEAGSSGLSESRLRNLRDLLAGGKTPGAALPAFRMARLFLRVPRQEDAIRAVRQLDKLTRLSPPERSLLNILETAFAPNAEPAETVKLAMAMAQSSEDTDVALALCQDLGKRRPSFAAAQLCVGELAGQQGRTGLAIRAFERAQALAPGDKAVWERLGQLYLLRLSDLVGEERTTELDGALKQIEAYQARMAKAFPGESGGGGMAAALAEVGRGYYNAGRVEEALRYLDRSVQAEPNAAALELLGTVQLKRGKPQDALATLERARAVEVASQRGDPLFKVYFRARIGRLIADAMDQGGDRPAAQDARRAGVKDWDQLLGSDRLMPERRGEAELERAKLLYELGDRDAALTAMRAAIDAVPEDEKARGQGQVYADGISFLVQRGEIEEAVDAYHKAISRGKVGEYLKVYCSLWVNDLLLRAGQPEDPLATSFLKSLRGGKWYAELARWATGQQGDEAMLQRADTVGKKAEASFYLGLRQARAGNGKRAEELFRKVIESDMMAFFEYEAAGYYLRRGGPPSQPVLRGSAPAKKEPKKEQPRRPAGSI